MFHFFANFSIAVPKNIAIVRYSTASTSSLLGAMSFGLNVFAISIENSTTAPSVPITRFDDTSSPVPNSLVIHSFIATKLEQKEKPQMGLYLAITQLEVLELVSRNGANRDLQCSTALGSTPPNHRTRGLLRELAIRCTAQSLRVARGR